MQLLADRLVSSEGVRARQCKLGDSRWSATASQPDFCARLAQLAARANSPHGSDMYCINDFAKTIKKWKRLAILKYASTSHALPPSLRAAALMEERGPEANKRTEVGGPLRDVQMRLAAAKSHMDDAVRAT